MTRRVGVIGLGVMGGPMALNLLKAGFEVTVHSRSAARCEPARRLGAKIADSPAAVAQECEAVLTMLPDDEAVKATMLGPRGVMESARAGLLVIDSSTVLPETSKQVAAALLAKGAEFLDAPVTGSKPQAEQAQLFFLVGGPESAYRRAVPLLEAMGRRHEHLGDTGAGACAKLCNNLMGLVNLAGFCEGLALGRRFGLDPRKLFEVISDSGGKSGMADTVGPRILARDAGKRFALTLADKDLRLVRTLATAVGQCVPVTEAAGRVYDQASAAVSPDADISALYRWFDPY